jgi:hypothetical protein
MQVRHQFTGAASSSSAAGSIVVVSEDAAVDKLQDALAECILDLRAVISLAADRARGRHPSMPHVLGLPDPSSKPHVRLHHDLLAQLKMVSEMRQELTTLRNILSEDYAVGR